MSGSVGYRLRPSGSRSPIAVENRASEMVPASHRLRRTATVSTSTRSGAATGPAPRISPRARLPSAPSSPITFANTEASTTINAAPVPRADPQRPVRVQRLHPGAGRSAPAPPRPWAARPSAAAHQRGTAAAIAHAARRDAEARRAHHPGYRERAHSCLQNAITGSGRGMEARDPRCPRYSSVLARNASCRRRWVRASHLHRQNCASRRWAKLGDAQMARSVSLNPRGRAALPSCSRMFAATPLGVSSDGRRFVLSGGD